MLSAVVEELPFVFLSFVEYEPLLNPSSLFELVESLLVPADDLLDEPELLKNPELNPLLDFELLEPDLLLKLDLLLDFAKATVLLAVFIPINTATSRGKLENININVKSIVITYFLLILLIVTPP